MDKKYYLLIIILLLSATGLGLNYFGFLRGLTGTPIDSRYKSITPQEAKIKLDSDNTILLIDVRNKDEYDSGHISGSINLPVDDIQNTISNITTDKDTIIYVYCRSGMRSKVAATKLNDLGYTNVYDLGGISSWPYEVVK